MFMLEPKNFHEINSTNYTFVQLTGDGPPGLLANLGRVQWRAEPEVRLLPERGSVTTQFHLMAGNTAMATTEKQRW